MTETPATTQTVATPSPPDEHGRDASPGFNLREVFRAAWTGGDAPTGTGHRRVVRTVDPTPRDVSALPPLPVVGYADGVQARMLLRHTDHRPITLMWVAAGAVGRGGKFLAFRQRLALVGSAADEALLARLGELGRGLPFDLLEDLTPWGIATATQNHVDRWRRELEGDVVTRVPTPGGQHLVVDGSIRGYRRDGLVGVVKDVAATQYLADESVIPDRAGWRSPVFALPATTTVERDVVSAYLRLHPAPGSSSWSHGLIRLEAHDPAILDAACALAMTERQSSHSGDARWAVHLRGMRRTEEVLGAFRPYVFDF